MNDIKELMAKKPYATIEDIGVLGDWPKGENKGMIRVYCTQSPDVFNFQIRTFKPINWGGRKPGKSRNMIANVRMTITEMEEVLEYMKAVQGSRKPLNTKSLDRFVPSD